MCYALWRPVAQTGRRFSMPRHQRRGDGGPSSYASAWARGRYEDAARGDGGQNAARDEQGDDDQQPSTSGSASSFNVKLAMWDLGQCDRKRHARAHVGGARQVRRAAARAELSY